VVHEDGVEERNGKAEEGSMKEGQVSRTAVRVAMGRALADRLRLTPRFVDPVALAWLPEPERRRVLSFPGAPPRAFRERMRYGEALAGANMMAARSVEVDDAVRATKTEQLVILGAGHDTRAWRMEELSGATVFEVDHPDTQKDKRARVGDRAPKARALHFVPVDFTRDSLDEALARAGHDPARTTTWIWEGVVMYLTRRDIESTLRVIEKRSALESRLVIVYSAPALILLILAPAVKRMGEPLRSVFRPRGMSTMLARHGFRATRDVGVADIASSMSLRLPAGGLTARHLRVVTAER
jgi:methyltransferase (TIGR00027 family)